MAITWTKDWSASDDGTVLKGIDLRNIQDDINTQGISDAVAIHGFPIDVPTIADDGKALTFDDTNSKFIYTDPSGLPAGMMSVFAGAAAPAGWELCDGSAISRTTFADLFAEIGTTFGVGDGSTTFNIPDARGRGLLGLDNMGGSSANRVTDAQADILGGSSGAEDSDHDHGGTAGAHQLTIAEMPAHTHTQQMVDGAGANPIPGASSGDPQDADETASTGGDGTHDHTISNVTTNVMNPFIAINWIIKT